MCFLKLVHCVFTCAAPPRVGASHHMLCCKEATLGACMGGAGAGETNDMRRSKIRSETKTMNRLRSKGMIL